MPGEFGGEMPFLLSLRFTPKACGSRGGGKQTRTFGLFLPAFSICLSVAFETDDKRESTEQLGQTVDEVNEKAARAGCLI